MHTDILEKRAIAIFFIDSERYSEMEGMHHCLLGMDARDAAESKRDQKNMLPGKQWIEEEILSLLCRPTRMPEHECLSDRVQEKGRTLSLA